MEDLKISDDAAAPPQQQQQQKKGKKEKKKKEGGGEGGDGKPKLSRAEIKAQRMAARQQKQQQQQEASADPLAGVKYGDLPLIQSQTCDSLLFTDFDALEAAAAGASGEALRIRGRIHTVRGKGKSAFVVLRDGTQTVQVVFFVDKESQVVSKGMVKFVSAVSKESIVDIIGVPVKPDNAVDGCTLKHVEIQGQGIWAISRAKQLPFEIADACR